MDHVRPSSPSWTSSSGMSPAVVWRTSGSCELVMARLFETSPLPRNVPAEEIAHQRRDRVDLRLEREVPRVEEVVLERLQIALVRLGTGRRKDRIVLAP